MSSPAVVPSLTRGLEVDMERLVDQQAGTGALRDTIAQLLPELRAAARLLTGTRAEADDLVQEAVLRMLRGLDSFTMPEPGVALRETMRPWGLAILRNVLREGWRKRRREQAHLALESRAEPVAPGGQETAGRMRDLGRALAALTPTLREAVVLVGAQGLSNEQAAAICGVPVGTMKARVSRARRQLASSLGGVIE
jgi:RNA polymerase sigma-70 factor (ECF subfamily)